MPDPETLVHQQYVGRETTFCGVRADETVAFAEGPACPACVNAAALAWEALRVKYATVRDEQRIWERALGMVDESRSLLIRMRDGKVIPEWVDADPEQADQ